MKLPSWVLPASAVLFCVACASIQSPLERARTLAAESGFLPLEVPDTRLRAFSRRIVPAAANNRVTVYIESDGAPWRFADEPPADPTPLRALVLGMAAADPSPVVVYLGRPCQYLEKADLEKCDPQLWMQARFSEGAVAAMNAAVDRARRDFNAKEVNLVGYSGGGAMAALIAARRDDVRCLVTVAAPLDTRAWTTALRVSPLALSNNPADVADRLRNLPQTHFRGVRDTLVPPATSRRFLEKTPGATVIDRESFDHRCCWQEQWRELMRASCLAQ